MQKPAPEAVVEGLTSKADKIRALAQAGYFRTEIARFLEIRYQHVRNVLVKSGIENLQSADINDPKSALLDPEPWPITRLLDAGFELISSCDLTTENAFKYSRLAPSEPGVYAFAVNGTVAYIGLTRGALRKRLGHYVYGHAKQRTSARVKGLILSSLARGDKVSVCIARPPTQEWNGLPVDTAAGLETGLIKLIRPPWNQQGVN